MNYKEEYQKALERAKKGLPIDEVFPELKESEDERIRKELLEAIDEARVFDIDKEVADRWIAYLEKHKEQKPESCDCSRDEESYTNGIHHVLMNPEAYGLIKQKPAGWSEEDEKMLNCIIERGNSEIPKGECGLTPNQVAWLETRFKYLRPQPKVEWGEEKYPKDIGVDPVQFCFDNGINLTPFQAKKIATHYLMIGHNNGYVEGRKNAHIPAKELGLPSSMDYKQEWSEEDEKMRKHIVADMKSLAHGDESSMWVGYAEWLEGRLKSLHPQPHWKPSEEQIDALEWMLTTVSMKDGGKGVVLKNLINELKKLM